MKVTTYPEGGLIPKLLAGLLYHLTLHCTPPHTIPHHTTLPYPTPHHTIPHLTIPHHTTTPHHTTPHYTLSSGAVVADFWLEKDFEKLLLLAC